MNSYSNIIQHIYENVQIFKSKCTANLKRFPDDEFLNSAIKDFTKTEVTIQSEMSNNLLRNVLQSFTKAVLDMTFFDESRLVEEEFKARSSPMQMMQIIEYLDLVEKTCTMLENEYKMVELLGEELAECLLWRKGALLYMFCHSKWEDKQWKQDNSQQFHQFLLQGVKELQKMLEIRGKVNWSDASISGNDTSVLVEKGIYSDTHLLAIMYAAEMCYWYVKENAPDNDVASETGRRFLGIYIAVVEGPLKHASWQCDRAKKYLGELQS